MSLAKKTLRASGSGTEIEPPAEALKKESVCLEEHNKAELKDQIPETGLWHLGSGLKGQALASIKTEFESWLWH